jgi:NADPH-dependent 2,4-dienoyl-CoA reductase/sulfur reductase-like enzyme
MTFTLNGAATLEPIASHIGNQKEKPFVQPDHTDVDVAKPVITKTGAASMNDAQEASAPDVMADVVIVGTGPAGASLACFLASYGKNFVA